MDRDRNNIIDATSENTEAGDQLTPQQEFIADQTTCCLCGGNLSFTHNTDHLTLMVVEDARCTSCHIPLRQRSHRLQ